MLNLLLVWIVVANFAKCDDNPTRVAFVFAGGVRSFVLPVVHESIRENLIGSFCPSPDCIADVFARVSIEDNIHDGVGYNAAGKKIDSKQRSELTVPQTVKSLERISSISPHGHLYYKVVNIGSDEESREMDAITSKHAKQQVYRDLDPRRYSMYFNRAAAFKMCLKEETRRGKIYTWVIHARLDCAWGAAVRPFHHWSNFKVWVPDTWYADVPDTFLILPRHRAEQFFDLDLQYDAPPVMCLGGPNFDPATITNTSLRQRGYSNEQIALVRTDECMTKYNQELYIVEYDEKNNITWTTAGSSEDYLRRKFDYYGITRAMQTIGFSSFFMFIVRYPLNFVCFYTEPRYFIPWVKMTQNTTDAVGVGCNTMWKDINMLHNRQYEPNCDVESLTSKHPQVDRPLSTCLLDRRVTDWNFMPFRVRRPGRGGTCLDTRVGPPGSGAALRTMRVVAAACTETYFDGEYRHDYHAHQLFSLYPLSPLPQRLSHYNFNDGQRCLTVLPAPPLSINSASSDRSGGSNNESVPASAFAWVLMLQRCDGDAGNVGQLFRVHVVRAIEAVESTRWRPRYSSLATESRGSEGWRGGSAAVPRNSSGPAPGPSLPPVSVARLTWMGLNESLCVGFNFDLAISSPFGLGGTGTSGAGAGGGAGGGGGEGSSSGVGNVGVKGIAPAGGVNADGVGLVPCWRQGKSKNDEGGARAGLGGRQRVRNAALVVLERTVNKSPSQ